MAQIIKEYTSEPQILMYPEKNGTSTERSVVFHFLYVKHPSYSKKDEKIEFVVAYSIKNPNDKVENIELQKKIAKGRAEKAIFEYVAFSESTVIGNGRRFFQTTKMMENSREKKFQEFIKNKIEFFSKNFDSFCKRSDF